MSKFGENWPDPFDGQRYADIWSDGGPESLEVISRFDRAGIPTRVVDIVPGNSARPDEPELELPMARVGEGYEIGPEFAVGSLQIFAKVFTPLVFERMERSELDEKVTEFSAEIGKHINERIDEWNASL